MYIRLISAKYQVERLDLCYNGVVRLSNYERPATMNIKEIITDCKAINWLIARVNISDYSKNGEITLIGEFKGNLPYNMKEQICEYAKANGGDMTGKMSATIIETDTEWLRWNVEFGSTKSTSLQVKFYISYNTFN